METIKKIGLLFLAFFSFVCIVGGIGTTLLLPGRKQQLVRNRVDSRRGNLLLPALADIEKVSVLTAFARQGWA